VCLLIWKSVASLKLVTFFGRCGYVAVASFFGVPSPFKSLQHMLSLLCLHQLLPRNESKQCLLLSSLPAGYHLTTYSFTHDGNTLKSQLTKNCCWFSLYSLATDLIENTASNDSSVVAWLFLTAEICLLCHCPAVHAFLGSAFPAFIHHGTILVE
jgi:hypothetical protein